MSPPAARSSPSSSVRPSTASSPPDQYLNVVPAAAPSREQRDEIRALVRALKRIDPDTNWKEWCYRTAGVPYAMLTGGGAAILIRELQEKLGELAGTVDRLGDVRYWDDAWLRD